MPVAPASLHVRRWGQECLVFHEPSGETHLLSPLAALLFQGLIAGGGPEMAVVDGALRALDCAGDGELEALARQTLAHLAKIGLARYCAR